MDYQMSNSSNLYSCLRTAAVTAMIAGSVVIYYNNKNDIANAPKDYERSNLEAVLTEEIKVPSVIPDKKNRS